MKTYEVGWTYSLHGDNKTYIEIYGLKMWKGHLEDLGIDKEINMECEVVWTESM